MVKEGTELHFLAQKPTGTNDSAFVLKTDSCNLKLTVSLNIILWTPCTTRRDITNSWHGGEKRSVQLGARSGRIAAEFQHTWLFSGKAIGCFQSHDSKDTKDVDHHETRRRNHCSSLQLLGRVSYLRSPVFCVTVDPIVVAVFCCSATGIQTPTKHRTTIWTLQSKETGSYINTTT